jgi:hypothetical protein
MTSAWVVHQALHGYQRGHELLASSVALGRQESVQIAELSDLSGYLPSGVRFERYWTGYPCGRWYVVACTWMDHAAPRMGAVLTHSLLIEPGALAGLAWPWALTALHRRPADAADVEGFSSPLRWRPLEGSPAVAPVAVRRAIAGRFFGSEERPLLWRSDSAPEESFAWLWSTLWLEARRELAFCTFAVQPRSVQGRLMDLQGVPPEAMGAFVRFSGRVESRLGEEGLSALVAEGREATRRWDAWCAQRGLAMPPAGRLGGLVRLMELEVGASERLAAARACADLVELLWPGLGLGHRYVRETAQRLVERLQATREVELWRWELGDLLGRSWMGAGSSLSEEEEVWVASWLGRLVREQAQREPVEVLAAAESLNAQVSGRALWLGAFQEGLRSGLRQAAEPARWLPAALEQGLLAGELWSLAGALRAESLVSLAEQHAAQLRAEVDSLEVPESVEAQAAWVAVALLVGDPASQDRASAVLEASLDAERGLGLGVVWERLPKRARTSEGVRGLAMRRTSAPWRSRWLGQLAVEVACGVMQGGLEPAVGGAWWSLGDLRERMEYLRVEEGAALERCYEAEVQALPRLVAAVAWVVDRATELRMWWVVRLVTPALGRASAEAMEAATSDLERLLRASELLRWQWSKGLIHRLEQGEVWPSAWLLLVWTFPVFMDRHVAGPQLSGGARWLGFASSNSERYAFWSSWIWRLWAAKGWPLEALLALLGQDRRVAERLLIETWVGGERRELVAALLQWLSSAREVEPSPWLLKLLHRVR